MAQTRSSALLDKAATTALPSSEGKPVTAPIAAAKTTMIMPTRMRKLRKLGRRLVIR